MWKENYDRTTIRRQGRRSRTEKGEQVEERRDGWNVVSSQLTSHLTSAWKVKVSLDVYSKSYETRVPDNFCPESKKENQKGLYRCAIDFQLTLVSFPMSRATSPDLESARVALSQVTGILVVR